MKSGLEIKEIEQFMEWCADGSEDRLNEIIPGELPKDIKALYDRAHE